VVTLRERLAHQPPGYRFTIGRILAIYAGLMAALMLAALDQTIVATALPQIVSELGGLTSYTWVFTAYMLGSTVTVPLYGKLGDVYGRRPLLVVSIGIFLAGSVLCGLSTSMPMLVACRAIQGLGAGGLFPLALATVGSIVPPRDRGRYQGLIGAVFAAASIAGPALGGWFVDNLTWRWIFWINLPVGGVALAVIMVTMPRRAERRMQHVDIPGAALLALGAAPLLLALVWGGRDYAWLSPQVLGAFAVAAAGLGAFALWERHTSEPILPFELLRNRTVAASTFCMALVGMAMFGTITFVPLFVQGVIGTSATSSGVVLTPFMLGAVATSIVSGQVISRVGRYKQNVVLGPLVLGAGLLLLWRMGTHTTNGEAARNMVVAGVGLGAMMQIFVLSVQNAVPRSAMGSATALGQFARQVGATVGVAVMGVIVNQGLPTAARGRTEGIHRLPPALRGDLAHALRPAFLTAACVCGLVFLAALFGIKEVPLRSGVDEPVGGGEPAFGRTGVGQPD
jgi:EmrB/QacA subfamily drug resistance transporter